jgi:hypothetical protein
MKCAPGITKLKSANLKAHTQKSSLKVVNLNKCLNSISELLPTSQLRLQLV